MASSLTEELRQAAGYDSDSTATGSGVLAGGGDLDGAANAATGGATGTNEWDMGTARNIFDDVLTEQQNDGYDSGSWADSLPGGDSYDSDSDDDSNSSTSDGSNWSGSQTDGTADAPTTAPATAGFPIDPAMAAGGGLLLLAVVLLAGGLGE